MCYDDNARPPMPPGTPGHAHGEDIVLTAPDGNRLAAYYAVPDGSQAGGQVIIYPDVRGLHQFYKELALRFAEAGIPALAIDYFGRTAGLTARDDSFEFMPHVMQLKIESFFQDVTAGLAYMRDHDKGAIFPVGFCMGGAMSLVSATNADFGFGGVVAFYAGLSRNFGGRGTVLEQAEGIKYPVLAMFGGADQGIPPDQVQSLTDKLALAGVEHNIITYPDAPHSFFDRRATDFAAASTDAWQQVLSFVSAHSK